MAHTVTVCWMHKYELLHLLLAEALIIQALGLSAQSLPVKTSISG